MRMLSKLQDVLESLLLVINFARCHCKASITEMGAAPKIYDVYVLLMYGHDGLVYVLEGGCSKPYC